MLNLDKKVLFYSRKVLLIYLYRNFLIDYIIKNDYIILDLIKLDDFQKDNIHDLKDEISKSNKLDDFQKEIEYIIKFIFYQKNEENLINIDYIKQILDNIGKYSNNIGIQVNKFANKFQFEEMDIIDKIIILIGIIEHGEKMFERNIILNEMIELGKRFGDEGTYKLINAILEKILI